MYMWCPEAMARNHMNTSSTSTWIHSRLLCMYMYVHVHAQYHTVLLHVHVHHYIVCTWRQCTYMYMYMYMHEDRLIDFVATKLQSLHTTAWRHNIQHWTQTQPHNASCSGGQCAVQPVWVNRAPQRMVLFHDIRLAIQEMNISTKHTHHVQLPPITQGGTEWKSELELYM